MGTSRVPGGSRGPAQRDDAALLRAVTRGDEAAFIWGIGVRRLIDAIRREHGARPRPAWRAAEPEAVISAEEQVLLGIEHGRLGQALATMPAWRDHPRVARRG